MSENRCGRVAKKLGRRAVLWATQVFLLMLGITWESLPDPDEGMGP